MTTWDFWTQNIFYKSMTPPLPPGESVSGKIFVSQQVSQVNLSKQTPPQILRGEGGSSAVFRFLENFDTYDHF